ncbi:polysaccharide export protein [Psychromonas sp. 14N.309.X.WAT.B.A12]|uniref:polysaccharide biosynthesis/export family protein n=1 Tax=Psychromonas sp. 14N.309.X.WAT.B.A12 TaxID=2998322 RepID=UPI0025B021DE|nr:polysaccharide biosynthesis/export family protein [Psychromonas sp. 14N.309.X.WAT.B.A12]MDN2664219.1 polysaccharide export protein [Psychromonas sp. 14N.309.X.WAT.B.A12]
MMNYFFVLLMFFSSFNLFAAELTNYRLDAGDEIKILVYDEPDLTIETVINDDGNINFPFIGLVSVTGKTLPEVQKVIHDGLLGDYLLNPSVQVDIITYRSFYIHGEVNQPGGYPYKPGLNIDQAIALAGGLTARASVSKIYLKKSQTQGEQKVELTYAVSPGDIITIKQSFF